MNVAGSTLEEAVENLTALRKWQPYRFGGRLFVAFLAGEAFAYRQLSALKAKAVKLGETQLSYVELQ